MIFYTPLGKLMPLLEIYPCNASAPQNSKQLGIAVKNYTVIVDIALRALNELLSGNPVAFDGLVGENACQIRAAMFADLTNQIATRQTVRKTVESNVKRLAEIQDGLRTIKLTTDKKAQMSLEKLLMEKNLTIDLPPYMLSAILAYVLTITKIQADTVFCFESAKIIKRRAPDKTDYSLLSAHLYGAKANRMAIEGLAKKLDGTARTLLSRMSVSYIQEEASLVQDIHLQAIVNTKNVMRDGLGRSCIPCFAVLDVVLRRSLVKQTPILLKVTRIDMKTAKKVDNKQLALLYRPVKDGTSYEVAKGGTKLLEEALPSLLKAIVDIIAEYAPNTKAKFNAEAGIVIEGFSIGDYIADDLEVFLKKLASRQISDLILANAARHPQYPGNLKALDPPIDGVRREQYMKLAIDQGIGEAVPSILDIDHIYCDTLYNQFLK